MSFVLSLTTICLPSKFIYVSEYRFLHLYIYKILYFYRQFDKILPIMEICEHLF